MINERTNDVDSSLNYASDSSQNFGRDSSQNFGRDSSLNYGSQRTKADSFLNYGSQRTNAVDASKNFGSQRTNADGSENFRSQRTNANLTSSGNNFKVGTSYPGGPTLAVKTLQEKTNAELTTLIDVSTYLNVDASKNFGSQKTNAQLTLEVNGLLNLDGSGNVIDASGYVSAEKTNAQLTVDVNELFDIVNPSANTFPLYYYDAHDTSVLWKDNSTNGDTWNSIYKIRDASYYHY